MGDTGRKYIDASRYNRVPCAYKMRRGWYCSRRKWHYGPCALRPSWWNIPDRIRYGRW